MFSYICLSFALLPSDFPLSIPLAILMHILTYCILPYIHIVTYKLINNFSVIYLFTPTAIQEVNQLISPSIQHRSFPLFTPHLSLSTRIFRAIITYSPLPAVSQFYSVLILSFLSNFLSPNITSLSFSFFTITSITTHEHQSSHVFCYVAE